MTERRTSERRQAEPRWRSGGVYVGPPRIPIRGPHAGGRKYDILTALAVMGLSGTPADRCTALRLIAMITARYDWTSDSVAVGQAELARLWATSLRTVKREMKRLMNSGLLVCLAAGVRGRVGVYRLDPAALRRLTEGSWARVGPDFAERMGVGPEAGLGAEQGADVVRVTFGSERGSARGSEPEEAHAEGEGDEPEWARLQGQLRAADPAIHAAWFARLSFGGREGDEVRIDAPSRFVASYVETHLAPALTAATQRCYGARARLVLRVAGGG